MLVGLNESGRHSRTDAFIIFYLDADSGQHATPPWLSYLWKASAKLSPMIQCQRVQFRLTQIPFVVKIIDLCDSLWMTMAITEKRRKSLII